MPEYRVTVKWVQCETYLIEATSEDEARSTYMEGDIVESWDEDEITEVVEP